MSSSENQWSGFILIKPALNYIVIANMVFMLVLCSIIHPLLSCFSFFFLPVPVTQGERQRTLCHELPIPACNGFFLTFLSDSHASSLILSRSYTSGNGDIDEWWKWECHGRMDRKWRHKRKRGKLALNVTHYHQVQPVILFQCSGIVVQRCCSHSEENTLIWFICIHVFFPHTSPCTDWPGKYICT